MTIPRLILVLLFQVSGIKYVSILYQSFVCCKIRRCEFGMVVEKINQHFYMFTSDVFRISMLFDNNNIFLLLKQDMESPRKY